MERLDPKNPIPLRGPYMDKCPANPAPLKCDPRKLVALPGGCDLKLGPREPWHGTRNPYNLGAVPDNLFDGNAIEVSDLRGTSFTFPCIFFSSACVLS
jgi:hypothetical protein